MSSNAEHSTRVLARIVWLFVALGLACLLRSAQALAGLLAALVLLWLLARLSPATLLRTALVTLPFGLALGLLQLLSRRAGPVALSLGPVQLHRPALKLALVTLLRLPALALSLVQFGQWIQPAELSRLLASWGVPRRYALLPTLAFRALPLLQIELQRVIEGQELRGVELHGALHRALAIPRLLLPMTLSTLRLASDMSLALELRGYGSETQR
jgi:energy-coupling factor transporter transmembrane protein EcfT